MTIGKRIKAARKRLKKKVTQPQIADEFGVTTQTVSNWECDANDPEIDKIVKLARILMVPTNWLLEGKGTPPEPDALESVVEQLDPANRQLLEAMARTLLEQQSFLQQKRGVA